MTAGDTLIAALEAVTGRAHVPTTRGWDEAAEARIDVAAATFDDETMRPERSRLRGAR